MLLKIDHGKLTKDIGLYIIKNRIKNAKHKYLQIVLPSGVIRLYTSKRNDFRFHNLFGSILGI